MQEQTSGSGIIVTRYLPLRRQREHVDSLRRDGKFGIIPNFILRSDLTKSELIVLCHFLLLGAKQHPTKKEVAADCKLRPQEARSALNSLCQRRILVERKVKLSRINFKSIYHITHPALWILSARQSFDLSLERDFELNPAFVGPHPALSKTPLRINECEMYLKDSGGYCELPRLLTKIDLPYYAKIIWMYIASLPEFEHPTVRQISRDVGLSFGSIRKYVDLLIKKRMIVVSKSHRFASGRVKLEQTYHTVDVALWDFEEARQYSQPKQSILYDTDFINFSSRNQTGPSRGIKRDPHEESNGTLTRNQTGPSEESNGTLRGIKRDPQRNPAELESQGLEGPKNPCETIPCETIPYETGCMGETIESQPHSHFDSVSSNFFDKEDIVELAQEIEPVFRSNGGYVRFKKLNGRVESLLREKGEAFFKDFSEWLKGSRKRRYLREWDNLVKAYELSLSTQNQLTDDNPAQTFAVDPIEVDEVIETLTELGGSIKIINDLLWNVGAYEYSYDLPSHASETLPAFKQLLLSGRLPVDGVKQQVRSLVECRSMTSDIPF